MEIRLSLWLYFVISRLQTILGGSRLEIFVRVFPYASVHQSFILGPMLFLIYADDLIYNMTIYADDIHSTLSVITLKCLNLNLI